MEGLGGATIRHTTIRRSSSLTTPTNRSPCRAGPYSTVTDGAEAALEQAYEAADRQDVRLAGGASTIQQYLRAGLVDEMHLAYSPLLLGSGERLWSDLDGAPEGYEIAEFAVRRQHSMSVLCGRAESPCHHVASGMGASRTCDHRQQQIGAAHQRHGEVPSRMASCEFGRPAGVSPKTPPPSSRNISTACSGRTRSESPMMRRVGALIARMASTGRSLI